jgi:hypothetical protein
MRLLRMPNCEQTEAKKPGNFKRLPTGTCFPVPIQVQLGEPRITLRVMSNSPPESVEARAQIQFGVGVKFEEPRQSYWTRNQV